MNNNNIIKNIFIIVIIISLLFSFSYYLDSSEDIDGVAYIMAIGVDSGKTAKYNISLQLSTIGSSSTDSSSEQSSGSSGSSSAGAQSDSSVSSNFSIYTCETDSIDSAINIANSYVNKNINLSHCKILVISEELAKNGVQDIVNSIINKVEVRPDCNIIVSQIPKDEFKNDKKAPDIKELLPTYYDVTSNTKDGNVYSDTVKLNDFYMNLNDSFTEPYATLGIASNTSTNTNTDNTKSNLDIQSKSLTNNQNDSAVETIGLAVFKGGNLVGTLSSKQTMAHQLIKDDFYYSTVNMPSPFNNNETLDIDITTLKSPKIKVSINNGSPFVEINLYLAARILSFNSKNLSNVTEENINIIKEYSSKYIEDQVYDYLNTTSKTYNSDISSLGKYAAKNFKTLQDWESYNWLENYKNATFKVKASVLVKSGHLLSNE